MTETREQWIEREARKALVEYNWGSDYWDEHSFEYQERWRNVVAPYYQEPLSIPFDGDSVDWQQLKARVDKFVGCDVPMNAIAYLVGAVAADTPPLRVPVDVDGLAEAMCNAANNHDPAFNMCWKRASFKDAYRSAARAALAYLNIDPCDKPEYDPNDVALRDALKRSQEIVNRWTPEQRNHNSIGYVGLQDNERAELENLRAECKRLRTQQPETRAVKIRFDVTAEDLFWEMDDDSLPYPIENVEGIALVQHAMDHLADHAVLEVPPGVPSVEELALIGRNAYQRALWFSEYNCYSDMSREAKKGDGAFAAAIRDRILAGIQRREWTEADVEELAKAMRVEYANYLQCKDTECIDLAPFMAEARAALAWFDGKRGEV